MGWEMVYNGIELAQYPICDTDIWVDAILANLDEILIGKYGKLVVADVVEKEILFFKKNDRFNIIAERFLDYKKVGKIVVINHSDIDEEDRKFLERRLIDCDNRFITGLADNPHEQHKGEIVSAIYAEYFEIPFLKSNDNAFREGNVGRIVFPNLIVKNLKDMLEDLVADQEKRWDCQQLIKDNRAFMDEGKRVYEQEKNAPITDEQMQSLLSKIRGKL